MSRQAPGAHQSVLGVLAFALVSSACGGDWEIFSEETPVPPPLPSSAALVSEPLTLPGSAARFAYVSMPPGGFPTGMGATIRNPAKDRQKVLMMVEGGWDPVQIAAETGDTLRITITNHLNETFEHAHVVPAVRRPVIVRTNPPHGRREAPLNTVLLVVFSEPIDPSTVTPQSVQLLRNGQPVVAETALSSDGLRMVIGPESLLPASTGFTLVVSRALTDQTGNQLEQGAAVEFTTATAAPEEMAGVYELSALITDFDEAWGDLTGYRYTALLTIDEGPPRFSGSFSDLRLVDSTGESTEIAASGAVDYYIDFAGRPVLELVRFADEGNSAFHLTLVVGSMNAGLIEGRFGCCGHIGGSFTAQRKTVQ